MKKLPVILMLLIISLSSLPGCMQRESADAVLLPELVKAESIMYEHPDSALQLLQSMTIPQATDRLQHATWALLMTQANYKNYLSQSDSLINIAYPYFIEKDDAQRKAMVLYYKGILCQEVHKMEDALNYCLEAAKEVEKTKDYRLAYLISSNIGMIYAYRELYDYAMEYFKKGNQYATLSNDQEYIASSYIEIARIYDAKKQDNESLEYYNKAIKICKENNCPLSLSIASNEIRHLYINKGNYQEALHSVQEAIKIRITDQNKLGLGDTYRYMHQYDSAYYYLNQAAKSANIYTASCAYEALYYMSKEKKDYKKATEYSGKLWFYQDSIGKIERSKAMIEMQEKYNQQKIINEKNLLKMEKNRTIRNMLVTLIVLICLIAITVYYYQRKVIRQKQELSEKEEKIRSFMVKIHENEITINRNQLRMEELSMQMEENKEVQGLWEEQQKILQEMQLQNETLKQENQVLQKNVGNYISSLNQKSKELDMLSHLAEENRYLHQREAFLCSQLIRKTELFNKIRKMSCIDIAHWEEIKEQVNLIFDDYIKRLYQQIPSLTENDIQLCCLIKLRFSNNEIAKALNISPTSVSKRKLRLKERILQEIGSLGGSQSLDLWLVEY